MKLCIRDMHVLLLSTGEFPANWRREGRSFLMTVMKRRLFVCRLIVYLKSKESLLKSGCYVEYLTCWRLKSKKY